MNKMMDEFYIEDDDIRIINPAKPKADLKPPIGAPPEQTKCDSTLQCHSDNPQGRRRKLNKWGYLLIAILIIILSCLISYIFYCYNGTKYYKEITENQCDSDYYVCEDKAIALEENKEINNKYISCEPIEKTESNAKVKYTLEQTDTVNDIVLHTLAPNATSVPELYVGDLEKFQGKFILAIQAADVRADNGGIVGDFIYQGEVLAKGESKRGFCAIVEGDVYMGCEAETPFFEKAYNSGGYFFRQYSLVHDCKMGERTPKGKSIRKALCYKNNCIYVVETMEPESYHDFSQALIDTGVKEAISLVGSYSLMKYKHEDGSYTSSVGNFHSKKKISYIVWRE